jgi:hypothetical protein
LHEEDRGCTLYGLFLFVFIFIETEFMFSLFGKKDKVRIIDKVFISSTAKQNAIRERIATQPDLIVIAWFEESYNQIKNLLASNDLEVEIFMAREIAAHHIHHKNILFYEHYPLSARENELLEKLQLIEAIFYSSLDEPLFMHFGGKKMISLLEKMGFSENESIEHPMISNAIKNAQEKISRAVVIEHSAHSQAEWFFKNIVK